MADRSANAQARHAEQQGEPAPPGRNRPEGQHGEQDPRRLDQTDGRHDRRSAKDATQSSTGGDVVKPGRHVPGQHERAETHEASDE
jgi:hypothetical protein